MTPIRLVKTYRVYFSQVNQTKYEVTAKTRENAIRTAKRLWRSENGQPRGLYVEEPEK